VERGGLEGVEDSRGVRGSHARQQLQHPEGSDAVARIVGPAQHGEQVLDVGGLEELETAVLHEGNAVSHQRELEHVAVVGVAEQHCLAPQLDTPLAGLEHPLDHVARLALFIGDRHVGGSRAAAAGAAQELAVLPAAGSHHRVGRIEHRLSRAIVLLEHDDAGRRGELLGKIEDVVDGRAPERVDRLRVVAHDCQPRTVRLQAEQDFGLDRVGVLVLVDQDVVELSADDGSKTRIADHELPVQQQVVVIEHLLRELLLDVRPVEGGERLLPVETPRVRRLERAAQRPLRIDPVRVDGEARVLAREPLLGLRQAGAVADHVHEVGCVRAIEHAEGRVETDASRVLPDETVAHRMEGPGPGQPQHTRKPCACPRRGTCLGHHTLRASRHLHCRPAREREQQQPLGRHTAQQQVGHPVGERGGLARARSGDDEQRPGAHATGRRRLTEGRGLALRGVQSRVDVVGRHGRATIGPACMYIQSTARGQEAGKIRAHQATKGW